MAIKITLTGDHRREVNNIIHGITTGNIRFAEQLTELLLNHFQNKFGDSQHLYLEDGVFYLPDGTSLGELGVSDYDDLDNRPAIDGHTLVGGNNTHENIGILKLSNTEIKNIFNTVMGG